jgi:hypothetical protein
VITAVEGWGDRNDLRAMREVTSLSLTHSNGYVLFGDPNSLPTRDHLHDLYPFQNKTLGHPLSRLAESEPAGDFKREFENGTVIFNPPSNGRVSLHFPEERLSAATGIRSRDQQVDSGDGDLFLYTSPADARR